MTHKKLIDFTLFPWLKNFWIQPAEGPEDPHWPISVKDLDYAESRLGVKFPVVFRNLMLLQNGGNIRRQVYLLKKAMLPIFVNNAIFDSLDEISSFQSSIELWMEDDEIADTRSTFVNCYPDRLVIFSGLDGHGFAAMDYGWRRETRLNNNEPEIIILEDDPHSAFGYKEVLRVKNFEFFCENLVYSGHDSESYYLGVNSRLQLTGFIEKISKIVNVQFEVYDDDRYGWFDFENYYIAWFDNRIDEHKVMIVVSPNQHRSGNYLFQDDIQFNYIIQLDPRDNDFESMVNCEFSEAINDIISKLKVALSGHVTELIAPYILTSQKKSPPKGAL